jgi:hypothetical protein
VRIEVVDGNALSAFAWLGIGRIEAGETLTVDFRQGMPEGWQTVIRSEDEQSRKSLVNLEGPVPFRGYEDTYTWIPESGVARVLVGAQVARLFVLGGTVPASRALQTYGYLDLIYDDNTQETYPLVYGFTLEGAYQLPRRHEGLHVLPVGDGTQGMLVIRPADKLLARVELRRAAPDRPRPRISAITCELAAPLNAGDGSRRPGP